MISLASFLDLLTSRTLAPSTMGTQLNSMRDRQPSDATKQAGPLDAQPTGGSAQGSASNELNFAIRSLAQGELHRCYDLLLNGGPTVDGPWGRIYPALGKIRQVSGLDMGYVTIKVMRVYQEFGTRSEHRGMVRLYRWLSEVSPKNHKPLKGTEEEQIKVFMTSSDKEGQKALQASAEVYADALLAIEHHVKMWNATHRARCASKSLPKAS